MSPQPFSDAFEKLEGIVEQFKNDSLPLESALALFEEGVTHIKTCQTFLNDSKGKLEILMGELDASGTPQTEAFEVE